MARRRFASSHHSAIAIIMLMLVSSGFRTHQTLMESWLIYSERNVASAKLPTEASKDPEAILHKVFSKPPPEQYMRACIVVRGANHLLFEWIAYHYTVLPLRHLIIGYDDTNATELVPEDDPKTAVLDRWNNTDLRFEVWRATDFAKSINYHSTAPQFQHLQRQHLFYARCMQYLQKQPHVGWVALTDIDEYIQLNPLDKHQLHIFYNESAPIMKHGDVQQGLPLLAPNETLWDRVQARKDLRQRLGLDNPPQDSTAKPDNETHKSHYVPTVVEFVDEYVSKHGGNKSSPCLSFSRRRYSAVVENFSNLSSSICVPKVAPNILDSLNISKLVTIQFLHHVNPKQFEHNQWAKVLVDLRHVSYNSIERVITLNNPHQPLDECAQAFVPDAVSIIRANHYINYRDIHVSRRGTNHVENVTTELKTWDKVAHARDYQTCDHIHGWLNDIVQEFGMEKVKHLLGYSAS